MSSLVQTGLFDTRVRIEQLDLGSRDNAGRWESDWTTLGSVRGRFTSVAGTTDNLNARDSRDTTCSFHCATSSISSNIVRRIRDARRVRIVWVEAGETRYFEVLGMPVDKGERRRQTRFTCIERDANWVGD